MTDLMPASAVPPLDLTTLSIVSPEVALQRPIADLIEAALLAAGHSDHTRRSYRTGISLFLQFLDAARGDLLPPAAAAWRPFAQATTGPQGKTIWTYHAPAGVLRLVDAALLDAFRAARAAAGDSPNAASQRIAAVRTFLAVAFRDRILTTEQAQSLGLAAYRQRQKQDRQPVGRRLSVAEVRRLRASVATATLKGTRDLAILDLMLYLGLRREEVVQLTLADLRQDGGRWWLFVAGKGQKTRRLKVHDDLYRSLWAWFAQVGIHAGGSGPIFGSVHRGDGIRPEPDGSLRPLTAEVVSQLVAASGQLAGLVTPGSAASLTPHDLRRTAARTAYDNRATLIQVQEMLGHADPKTTALYIGADANDADTAVDHVRY
jgi:integrase